MRKSAIHPSPGYFCRYIDLVEDIDMMEALHNSLADIDTWDLQLLEQAGDTAYAPGKWTPKEILQHIIDGERIMVYRALRYARKVPGTPGSIDFELINAESRAVGRTVTSLLGELRAVRLSTIALFESFDEETLLLTGINWKYEMSVLAMGFFLAGHQQHHFDIIREKYLPVGNPGV